MGGTVAITNGARTINLESAGSAGSVSFLAIGSTSDEVHSISGVDPLTFLVVRPGEINAMTEVFDIGNNFNVGNGAGTGCFFTAPTTDQYTFNFVCTSIASTGFGVASNLAVIQTPSRKFRCNPLGTFLTTLSPTLTSLTSEVTVTVKLDATDVVLFGANVARPSAASPNKGFQIFGANSTVASSGLELGLPLVFVSGFRN